MVKGLASNTARALIRHKSLPAQFVGALTAGYQWPRDYDRWLHPGSSVAELKALLKPYDSDLTEAYAVSLVVNSVKNDTEECIEPVEA